MRITDQLSGNAARGTAASAAMLALFAAVPSGCDSETGAGGATGSSQTATTSTTKTTTTSTKATSSSASTTKASGSTTGMTAFNCDPPAAPGSIYERTAESRDINIVDLVSMCQYRGDVMLIVNTAAH